MSMHVLRVRKKNIYQPQMQEYNRTKNISWLNNTGNIIRETKNLNLKDNQFITFSQNGHKFSDPPNNLISQARFLR